MSVVVIAFDGGSSVFTKAPLMPVYNHRALWTCSRS